ncbi:restriction endonuclease subunit S [Streptomyces sp. NPDC006997]|uniref:restriction endonuclease subunit S n=1 Tax=Streptomyces sp. NPDC006997 TaxID=3155356 RepID=UPI0033ECDF29
MSEGGIPSEVPKGWARVRLGDILARIEAGKSYKCEPRPASAEEWGVIKVSAMTWGDFDECENKAVPVGFPFNPDYEIRPGDILLSRANTAAYVGASVLVRQCRPRLLLSDKSLRLVPADGVDREWLAYLLSSPVIRSQISERATGTKDSMRNISQGALGELECLLPPVDEQQRIVAALEGQLAHLEKAESSIVASRVKTKQLRHSALQSLRAAAVDSGAPLLSIAEIADTSLGKMLDRRKNSGEATPYLRNVNVRWGRFDLADLRTVPMSEEEQRRFSVRAGDLLVCEGGEPGRCAIWPEGNSYMAFQKALHRVRAHGVASAGWIALMLEEAALSKRFEHLLTGTTIKHLPQEKLRSLRIPVPDNKMQEEMSRWVSEAEESAHRLVVESERALARSSALRRSLLAEAFAGRLIPQNVTDEPADVLVGHIRAEREAARVTKPQRRSPRRARASRKDTPDTAPVPDAPPQPRADAPALASASQPTLDLEISS